MIDDELQGWIEKTLNETATEAESRLLEERLLSDSRARDHYLNEINLHASLRRRFSADADIPSPAPRPVFVWRKVGVGLAIAASVALLAGGGSFVFTPGSPPAVIAHVVGAYADSGVAYAAGEEVRQGRLAVIEGPAQMEVINEMRVVLHRGVVTATIPESAIGFVVDTAAAHVVDLGTSFGVSVSDEGLTDVCVFDGEVEVSSPTTQRTEAPRRVMEGEAIRTGMGSMAIDSTAYVTSRFEKAWPVNSGVLQTTGSMRFVSPGPDFHPDNYEDNEHIIVFPERQDFVPHEEIRVDMVDPGQYAKSSGAEKPTLLPAQRLTSYLLQLKAYPDGEQPNKRRSVRGQITFASPIVGVIMANRLLKQSETIFGLPDVEYPGARMIEARPEGDQRQGFDTVILAADRRTLIIELQENPGNLDQFRVLVKAE